MSRFGRRFEQWTEPALYPEQEQVPVRGDTPQAQRRSRQCPAPAARQMVCEPCLTAAYDADTCDPKRDPEWQYDFCSRHGDILAEHDCADTNACDCACNDVEKD